MNKQINELSDLFTNQNSATLKDFELLVQNFRNIGLQDDARIPLSYIVQSLYKEVPQNLQENMKRLHMQAYAEGYKDAEKEFGSKGDNTDEQSKET